MTCFLCLRDFVIEDTLALGNLRLSQGGLVILMNCACFSRFDLSVLPCSIYFDENNFTTVI